MADEDCWAIRAQAEALRSEISTLRGVVAALRSGRAPEPGVRRAPPRGVLRWAAIAFALGVAVTIAALALYRVAACP